MTCIHIGCAPQIAQLLRRDARLAEIRDGRQHRMTFIGRTPFAYGVKLSTTPESEKEFEGGATAPLPMPRLAKPARTCGTSPGAIAETAEMMPSRAWMKVGLGGGGFRPPLTEAGARRSASSWPSLATRLTNTSQSAAHQTSPTLCTSALFGLAPWKLMGGPDGRMTLLLMCLKVSGFFFMSAE